MGLWVKSMRKPVSGNDPLCHFVSAGQFEFGARKWRSLDCSPSPRCTINDVHHRSHSSVSDECHDLNTSHFGWGTRRPCDNGEQLNTPLTSPLYRTSLHCRMQIMKTWGTYLLTARSSFTTRPPLGSPAAVRRSHAI